jgi:hypothetical protein
VKGVVFQWVQVPPGKLVVFQPVAIQAAVEATKPSEPWVERVIQ